MFGSYIRNFRSSERKLSSCLFEKRINVEKKRMENDPPEFIKARHRVWLSFSAFFSLVKQIRFCEEGHPQEWHFVIEGTCWLVLSLFFFQTNSVKTDFLKSYYCWCWRKNVDSSFFSSVWLLAGGNLAFRANSVLLEKHRVCLFFSEVFRSVFFLICFLRSPRHTLFRWYLSRNRRLHVSSLQFFSILKLSFH